MNVEQARRYGRARRQPEIARSFARLHCPNPPVLDENPPVQRLAVSKCDERWTQSVGS
jgi:hypothetical protein